MDEETRSRRSKEQLLRESGASGERERHEEEFAADFAPAPGMLSRRELHLPEEDRPHESGVSRTEEESPSRTFGWTALTLAIISLFVMPVFLGISAIVLGIIAYMRGTRGLGAWSIVIGGISILSYVVLIPSYYS
jgi:hypothetical protein